MVPELIDPEWKWHLALLTDVTEMLNSFNLYLQEQGKLIFDMYSHIWAFEVKLALLLEQVKKHNFIHLPATQNLSAENPAVPFPAERCVEALEMLKAEFGVRFRELHVNAKDIRLFQKPLLQKLMKLSLLINLSWQSYRTVMFSKTHSSPVLLTSMPPPKRHVP